MDKMKTYSPIYCITIIERIDLFLDTHRVYMTSILYVQCLQISLHIDDYETVLFANKRPSGPNVPEYLHTSLPAQ